MSLRKQTSGLWRLQLQVQEHKVPGLHLTCAACGRIRGHCMVLINIPLKKDHLTAVLPGKCVDIMIVRQPEAQVVRRSNSEVNSQCFSSSSPPFKLI